MLRWSGLPLFFNVVSKPCNVSHALLTSGTSYCISPLTLWQARLRLGWLRSNNNCISRRKEPTKMRIFSFCFKRAHIVMVVEKSRHLKTYKCWRNVDKHLWSVHHRKISMSSLFLPTTNCNVGQRCPFHQLNRSESNFGGVLRVTADLPLQSDPKEPCPECP